MTRSIGIDFGTSTTVIKIQNDSKNPNCPVESLTFNGHPTLPTLAFRRPSEQIEGESTFYFGYEAEAMNNNGIKGELFRTFKMNLVSSNEQLRTEAQELTQRFFDYLHEAYMQQAPTFGPCDEEITYVSYPAKWPSDVRLFMKECAIKAGFGTEQTVHGVDEPTAAVLASLSEKIEEFQHKKILLPSQPLNVIMIDMGAGTTDIALFKLLAEGTRPNIYDVVTYPGITCDYLCGGREIDSILSEWVCNYIASIRQPPKLSKGRERKIRDTISQWKDSIVSPQLANGESIKTHPVLAGYREELIDEGFDLNPDIPPFKLGRTEFETLTHNHWESWRSLLAGALQESWRCGYNLTAADIDLIILAGGHSQWYGIKDFMLGQFFTGLPTLGFTKIETEPLRLMQSQRAHETVAKGLCLYDSEFDIKQVTANNVWVRFQLGDKVTEWKKAVEKNVTLPYTAEKIEFTIQTRANMFVRRKGVTIICETCQGDTQEDGLISRKEVLFPAQGDVEHFIKNILGGILLTPFAILDVLSHLDDIFSGFGKEVINKNFSEERNFTLAPYISVGTDGIVRVSGKITTQDTTINLKEHQI